MNDNRYGLYFSYELHQRFERARTERGLSAELYLDSLLSLDLGINPIHHKSRFVDLNQSRLFSNQEMKEDGS